MKNNTIRSVVATGIGASLFVIIGMFISIPLFSNTSIQLQYAVQALFAVLFGPGVGFFVGFIGHALKDFIQFGSPWWSWVISSGLVGLFIGLASKRFKVDKGLFATKDMVTFNIVQILANLLAWGVISPLGDILIYSEPANKVFIQGLIATLANAITIGIGGTLLILIYAKTRTQSNSLSKD